MTKVTAVTVEIPQELTASRIGRLAGTGYDERSNVGSDGLVTQADWDPEANEPRPER